jgi:CheY-like chemotaxis protein
MFRESDFMTTILIIDDSQLARNIVSGMVRGARPDWIIVTAKNADDALEKVNDVVPDVAIVDFNMPGMGWPQPVLRVARAVPGARHQHPDRQCSGQHPPQGD